MSEDAKLAALKAEVDALKDDMAELKADVKAIRSRTDKWSGVVGLAMLSIPALLGAAAAWLLHR